MTMHNGILIVEDDPNLGSTLKEFLLSKGYNCFLAMTAKEAREIFFKDSFKVDIILMDIGLPDGNGLELGKEFLKEKSNFVLLYLSALNDPETKFTGLDLGADDYITKPFDLRELTFRLNRILKFQNSLDDNNELIEIGPLKIWFNQYQVQDAQGNFITLSHKECGLLKLLYSKKNEVVSREEIIQTVWGENAYPTNRTVDNYIVKLRKWSDTANKAIINIASIRSVGYKLEIS